MSGVSASATRAACKVPLTSKMCGRRPVTAISAGRTRCESGCPGGRGCDWTAEMRQGETAQRGFPVRVSHPGRLLSCREPRPYAPPLGLCGDRCHRVGRLGDRMATAEESDSRSPRDQSTRGRRSRSAEGHRLRRAAVDAARSAGRVIPGRDGGASLAREAVVCLRATVAGLQTLSQVAHSEPRHPFPRQLRVRPGRSAVPTAGQIRRVSVIAT